jgi:hypothetical protein
MIYVFRVHSGRGLARHLFDVNVDAEGAGT